MKPGDVSLDPNSAGDDHAAADRRRSTSRCRTRAIPRRPTSAVNFQLTGGTQTISGEGTIPRIAAGGIQTASIPIQPAPDTVRS